MQLTAEHEAAVDAARRRAVLLESDKEGELFFYRNR